MISDTCFKQDTNSAELNSARHGQFQQKEKETPTTELNIFLSKKNVSTENKNGAFKITWDGCRKVPPQKMTASVSENELAEFYLWPQLIYLERPLSASEQICLQLDNFLYPVKVNLEI